MRIFVFGDSIAQGYFDSRGGWANRLMAHYAQQTLQHMDDEWMEVFNLGVSGNTARDVSDRLKDEFTRRSMSEDRDCIVIAVGINDAVLQANKAIIDIYEFQEIYESIIKQAQALSPRVLCVGLTAVLESQTDPWQHSTTGKQWKNNRINLFEDTIKQSSQGMNAAFLPLHDEFLRKLKRSKVLADGLHPNDAGHDFIFRKVLEAVDYMADHDPL